MTDPLVRAGDSHAPGREHSRLRGGVRGGVRGGDTRAAHAPGMEPRGEPQVETREGPRNDPKNRSSDRGTSRGGGSPKSGCPETHDALDSPETLDSPAAPGRDDTTGGPLSYRLPDPTPPFAGEAGWNTGELDAAPASSPECVRVGPRTLLLVAGLGGAYLALMSSPSWPLVASSVHPFARWWRVAAEHPLRTSTALTLLVIACVRRRSDQGVWRARPARLEGESGDAAWVPSTVGTQLWRPHSDVALAVAGSDPRPHS